MTTEEQSERDIVVRMKSDDGCVTVRDIDTMEQERIAIDELDAYFAKKFEF